MFTKIKAKKRQIDSGVTLIEMMIVLVIIAVVASMIVPNVMGRPDEARASVAQTDLRSISTALEFYRLDNQKYPTSLQGLSALVEKPTNSPIPTNWNRNGYLPIYPTDPWGNDYVYRSPGDSGGFDLISLGADGKPGGQGVDKDIAYGQRVVQN